MGTPLLAIKNLTVSFEQEIKSFTAVKDLSLMIKRGEIRALVGESGSGKSVTSMSILQLIPSPPATYKKGSILFYDTSGGVIDLLQTSASEIEAIRGSKIAMIFQEPMTALNPVLSCGKQIIETIMLHQGLTKEAATIEAIRLFTSVKINEPAKAINQRSDVCAVPAAGVVAEAMVALVLAEAVLEKFGGDSVAEVRRNFLSYTENLPYK